MRTLEQADLDHLDQRYYKGRWPYLAEAVRQLRAIPGIEEASPHDVLELGPYQSPIVPGCHIMDNMFHGPLLTHIHDANHIPWPVQDKRYLAFVGLQVLEHLEDKRAVWEEIRRVANWAVVSLPLRWPPRTGDHAGINRRLIHQWTRQRPADVKVIPMPGRPDLPRIVMTYNLS